jgi:tRNA threonylcarbamoyladenosine biosynthesis protein TsaE
VNAAPAAGQARSFLSRTEADTERLGAALGATLQPVAGRALRAWLAGDLGAGKTTLVRGLLRQQGVTGPVRSPTYSLLERYPLGALEVVHGDLYRLEGPGALAGLGLDEFDRAGALWLIEWPERGEGALPPPDLQLELSVQPEGHRIDVHAPSSSGAAWLARAAARFAEDEAAT